MINLLSSLLAYPFEKGAIEKPALDQSVLLWGAPFDPALDMFGDVSCLETFKPYADEWIRQGHKTSQSLTDSQKYDAVLCVLPKQKERSRAILAQAVGVLNENGLLLAVAANDAGGKRLESWFEALGLETQSLSKSKCRLVWAYRQNIDENNIQKFIEEGSQKQITIERYDFTTQPGIFGWNKIDVGSKILIETLPNKLSGIGADFGCGYGYLSQFILDGNNQIKKLYALDADYNALQCCKENLEGAAVEFLWEDLTQKPKEILPLDFIVMNPPFHDGKEMAVDVGLKFIETAALCLRKNGKLYMVANAHLPYERHLKSLFSNVEKVIEKQGFKVFHAVK